MNPAGHDGSVTVVDVALLSLVLGIAACAFYFVWRGRLERALGFVVALLGATVAAIVVHSTLSGDAKGSQGVAASLRALAVEPQPPPQRPAYADVVKADSPLVFYRLDERSGDTATDSSAHANDGTYTGSVHLGRRPLLHTDRTAGSASFSQGYVIESQTWETQAVTAECWVRPTEADIAGSARIIDNAWTDHDGNGFMLWISNRAAAFNTGWLSVVGTSSLAPGNIYHIVGTYDNAGGASLYVNGVQVAEAMPGSLPKPQQGDDSATYIGVLNTGTEYGHTAYFQGDISDCAVYDHALTPPQIATHYDAGSDEHVVPRPLPTPTARPAPPLPTALPTPLAYDAVKACVNGVLYKNNVLPPGKGEFDGHGFDRAWWGRRRGNPIGGDSYSGFRTSWGRLQYDTYFGDASDGLPGKHDPFYAGRDSAAAGSPRGVRIEALPMPADVAGDPTVGHAQWYSGVLDTPIDLQYGFVVARLRLPEPHPGMSPAWWLLTNNRTPKGQHGPLNGEWDVQEMFGSELGNGLNAGTILWNSGAAKPQAWGGTYEWPKWQTTTPSAAYHDYGALILPGGATISKDVYGPGGPGYVYGDSTEGASDYLDGIPLYGHTGSADVTSGVGWKELMVMFQVGKPNSWLGTPSQSDFPAYYWVQWIRVYRPTATRC